MRWTTANQRRTLPRELWIQSTLTLELKCETCPKREAVQMLSKFGSFSQGSNRWEPDAFSEWPRPRKRLPLRTSFDTWHTCAYTASNAAAATNADTPALSDSGVLYITNGHFLFQKPM